MHPAQKVVTSGAEAKVKFSFAAAEAGASFKCRLDHGPFKSCSSTCDLQGEARQAHPSRSRRSAPTFFQPRTRRAMTPTLATIALPAFGEQAGKARDARVEATAHEAEVAMESCMAERPLRPRFVRRLEKYCARAAARDRQRDQVAQPPCPSLPAREALGIARWSVRVGKLQRAGQAHRRLRTPR